MAFSRPMMDDHSILPPRWSAPISFNSRPVFTKVLFALGITLILSAAPAESTPDCVATDAFDATQDYFTDKVSPMDATSHWNVSYHNNYKVLTNTMEDQNYVLTLCGTPEPDANAVPGNAKFFSVPLKSVAVEYSTTVTYLEVLALRFKISNFDTTYLTSPCLNIMSSYGMFDQLEGLWGGNSTLRALQLAGVDALLGDTGGADDPQHIAISASYATSALGRGDWINFISTLFNKEAEATKHWQGVMERYECHSNAANTASEVTGKPLVAWMAQAYTWGLCVHDAGYKKTLIADAGGEMWIPETLCFDNTTELAHALSDAQVDIVIDETFDLKDWDEILAAYDWDTPEIQALNLTFLETGMVARNDRLAKVTPDVVASDWFESSMAEPDVILEDLITFIQPCLADTHDHARYWFRLPALGTSIVTIVAACPDPDGPLVIKADECPASGPGPQCMNTEVSTEDAGNETDTDGPEVFVTGAATSSHSPTVAAMSLAFVALVSTLRA